MVLHLYLSTVMALLSTVLLCAEASAHGEAVLCDATGDLVEQCGEFHECITDPEVSDVIGYCKAEAEDIAFTLCDRDAMESRCTTGEVCKIGTIDPRIGVCAEVAGLPPEETVAGADDHEGHDHDDHDHDHDSHDHDDHDDHDHGCQGSVRTPSTGLLLGLWLALGMMLKRAFIRSTSPLSSRSRG